MPENSFGRKWAANSSKTADNLESSRIINHIEKAKRLVLNVLSIENIYKQVVVEDILVGKTNKELSRSADGGRLE